MSDSQNAGFGQFVPGFDFLQNLTKGATSTIPQMSSPAHWIAPTLSVEELDKRISELKAVHFWLDQNSKALAATVQALEVQKMTLATLKGMNFNIGDLANAFKPKAVDAATAPKPEIAEKPAPAAHPGAGAAGLVDPMQLWGALTQQFQQIAASAMKDAGISSAGKTPEKSSSRPRKTSATVKSAAKKTGTKR